MLAKLECEINNNTQITRYICRGCLLVWDPQSSQIANNNIVQDIAATVYLIINFVYERRNCANSSGWSSVMTGVIQRRSAIYFSVRWCSLYNAFFSAFYSKQVSIMIYFYLNVFGSKNSNLSFHKKQLPIIAACSGFGWMFFSCIDRQFTSENF